MNRFVDLADLRSNEIEALLTLSHQLECQPQPDALAGKVLVLLFLNPSMRTQVSFQAAMTHLGGTAIVVTPQTSWSFETRERVVMDGDRAEHVREAIPVLGSYGDALGIRAFANGSDLSSDISETQFKLFDDVCPVPLINLESAINHPCQSLADWKTLDDHHVPKTGGKFVLSWANHPKALPLAVPAATVHMAAQRGMDVTVLRPEEFALPAEVMDKAKRAAQLSGGRVLETSDRDEGLDDAHVLYAKSWASAAHYGDVAAETELRHGLDNWCVDESWFKPATANCKFMHCLPVRRGVVVSDGVLDGARSIVLAQARNRLVVQTAVLFEMLANNAKTTIGSQRNA